MSDIKQFITNPVKLVSAIEEQLSTHITQILRKSGDLWRERNAGGVVSGSVLASCMRKAWYVYFANLENLDPDIDLQIAKRMWLGIAYEEMLGVILANLPEPKIIHDNSQTFPVNMTHYDYSDITLSATTDRVIQYVHNGVDYFIPVEIKTSQMSPVRWDKFQYWEHHVKQIMYWILYAKSHKLQVPYGIIWYMQRSDADVRYVIIPVDMQFRTLQYPTVQFEYMLPYLQQQVQDVVKHIRNKTLPAIPKDVPKYICESCSFRVHCSGDVNPHKTTRSDNNGK